MQIRTHMGVSLDGYVASADGRPALLSMPDFVPGESHGHPEFIANCDAVVMGRTTFDPALQAPSWPWSGLLVYVLTSRPLPTDLPAEVVSASSATELLKLMRARGSDRDVHLVGGPRTIQAFREIGALDRLEVVVLPILLGGGLPLSTSGSEPLRLALDSHRTFPDGSAELAYSVTRSQPNPVNRTRRRISMPDPTTSTVTSKDGTTIAFDRYGDGAPVVLVGGAFQYRAFDPPTVELAKLLSSDFAVYHYDRRGRGGSGDTPPYTIEREIEDLRAVVNEAGGSASVLGNSSGGLLALDAAAAGAPIDRLVLYEAPVIADDSRVPVPTDYLERVTGLLYEERRSDMVELFMTAVIGLPAEMVAGMRQSPMWGGFEAVAHTLIYDGLITEGTMTGKPLAAERWARVSAPTLVVDGGASDAWVHAGADELARVLPNAQRRTLEGQTHQVAPDVLAPAIREFFSD
jgi:pimeloyl-ACP methyl ester carboxylesterase/dihydrofolate reductase